MPSRVSKNYMAADQEGSANQSGQITTEWVTWKEETNLPDKLD